LVLDALTDAPVLSGFLVRLRRPSRDIALRAPAVLAAWRRQDRARAAS
jgi:hypothetical protein